MAIDMRTVVDCFLLFFIVCANFLAVSILVTLKARKKSSKGDRHET